MVIFVILWFVCVLGDVLDGDIFVGLVFGFLGLYVFIFFLLVLFISVYLGIMLVYGRLYVDSEMIVMWVCGISEWYVMWVMFFLFVFIMIVIGVIIFYFVLLVVENEY